MKSNIYKKITTENKFARRYYCNHARLNSIRRDKKENSKAFRRYNKKLCQKIEENLFSFANL